MNDLNNVTMIGRLTRDAELKTTSSGLAICTFSIANNQSRKVGDSWENVASFFDVSIFGKTAEALSKYLVKGKQIALTGELAIDKWGRDGVKHEKCKIKAQSVQLMSGGETSQDKPKDAPMPRDSRPVADDGFADDVPF